MKTPYDLSGKSFGNLVAIRRIKTLPEIGSIWMCRCACGNEVEIRQKNLANGHTKSCGCLKKYNNYRHGMDGTSEYRTWQGIHRRCYDKTNKDFHDYGGRGISVCERWHRSNKDGFINFFQDMGEKPGSAYSIDRLNVNGCYEPANCRWATPKQQAINRRPRRPKLQIQGATA